MYKWLEHTAKIGVAMLQSTLQHNVDTLTITVEPEFGHVRALAVTPKGAFKAERWDPFPEIEVEKVETEKLSCRIETAAKELVDSTERGGADAEVFLYRVVSDVIRTLHGKGYTINVERLTDHLRRAFQEETDLPFS